MAATLGRALVLGAACLGLAHSSRADERELASDQAVEVRPAAGDTHVFFATLDAGTFAHVELASEALKPARILFRG